MVDSSLHSHGSTDRFAILIGVETGGLREVEDWAGGENLTPTDTAAYLPAFIHALEKMAKRLAQPQELLRFKQLFARCDATQAFELLSSQSHPEAWLALRVLDWGPTLDNYLCFLVPQHGRFALTFRRHETSAVHSVDLTPEYLSETIQSAIRQLRDPEIFR